MYREREPPERERDWERDIMGRQTEGGVIGVILIVPPIKTNSCLCMPWGPIFWERPSWSVDASTSQMHPYRRRFFPAMTTFVAMSPGGPPAAARRCWIFRLRRVCAKQIRLCGGPGCWDRWALRRTRTVCLLHRCDMGNIMCCKCIHYLQYPYHSSILHTICAPFEWLYQSVVMHVDLHSISNNGMIIWNHLGIM